MRIFKEEAEIMLNKLKELAKGKRINTFLLVGEVYNVST